VIYNATAKTFTTFALNINDLPNDPHRSRLALAPRFFNVLDQYKPVQVSILPSLISPFLALPSKITHLVPAWSGCEMDPRGGIDPPRPLSPATAMNPVHTVDDLTPQSTAAKPSPLVSSLPIETGTILPQPSPRYPDQGNSPKPQPPPRANSPSDTEALTEVPHRTNSETAPGTVSPSIRRGDGQVVVPQPSDTRSILDPQEYSIGTQATVGDLSRARDSAGIEHKTLRSFSSGKPDPTQQDDSGDRLATWSKGPGSTPNQDVQDPLVTWLRRLGSTPVDYTKDPRTTGSENPEFPQDGIDSSSLAPGYTKPIPPAVAIQGQTITNNAAPITIGGAKVAYQSGILSVDNIIQPVPLATNRGAMHTNLFVVGDLSFSILPAAAQADVTHPVENAPGTTPHVDKNNIPPSKHPDSIKFTSHVDINNIPPGKHPDSLEYVMVGSQTFTLQSNAIQVAGKTLKAGDPAITVDGTPISLGYSEFVFGTRTEVFSLPTMSATPDTVVSMDDTIFTLKGGSLVVTGKTVTIGEPAATINGIPISLGYSEFVFGTRTEMFSLPTMSATPDTVLSMDDTIVTLKGGSLVVAGNTMTIGEPAATIDGIPISLGYSEFVFGTRTEVFSLPTMSVISDTVVSMDDTIVTLKGGSLVVAGKTVTIGEPAATINGIPISLGSSELVVGSQTRSFAFPINTMGPNDSGNLDELITPGLDRIGGGVVDTPSTPGTGTTGTSNAKDSTPYLGQTVNLCVPVRIYLAWATALLTVFLIWS
jgi:acetoacetate decarboxylase